MRITWPTEVYATCAQCGERIVGTLADYRGPWFTATPGAGYGLTLCLPDDPGRPLPRHVPRLERPAPAGAGR